MIPFHPKEQTNQVLQELQLVLLLHPIAWPLEPEVRPYLAFLVNLQVQQVLLITLKIRAKNLMLILIVAEEAEQEVLEATEVSPKD